MLWFRVEVGMLYRQSRVVLLAVLLAAGLALLVAPAQAFAAIRYVKPGGANAGACILSASACTLSYAITQAAPGDDIYISAGTYTEAQITVNKELHLTGGFNADVPDGWNTSTYTLTPTILDGQGTQRLLVISANNVVVENLTVRNGNATTSAPTQHAGGGILVTTAQGVVLRNLQLLENVASTTNATSTGGAIAVVGTSGVTIERTVILSNTTSAFGGGIGIRSGAGLQPIVTIKSSVIARNSAAQGGAIATTGAGRSVLSMSYLTLADNHQGTADEAIFLTEGSANAAEANQFNISYSLLTGNNTGLRSMTTIVPAMLSSGILMDPNVTTAWDGNLPALNQPTKRPLSFVNPSAGDYHLVAGSPAIDIAGNTAKIDLEGRQRVNSALCTPFTLCPMGRSDDYGAYEYVYTSPVIRYVASDGTDTLNNCLNSALPCATPENATKIALGGDEIRIAQGTYTDSDNICGNSAVLCVRQGITVTGGYTSANWNTPATDPALTIFDGQNIRQGILVDYDLPNASALIQNFTVRNGYSLGNGGGVGINTSNAGIAQNLMIRNCRVENSRGDGTGDGGGIFALAPVNLTIENCALSGNSVPNGRGGGLAITDANGTATYTLTNLTVFNNLAGRPDDTSPNGGRGGGLFLEGVGFLRQSEVYSNTAHFSGGGVSTGSNSAHPTVDRVYIHDNQAGVGGGFSIFLTGGANLQNSLLVRNVATSTVGLLTGQTTEPVLGGNAIHTPYVGVPAEPLRVINVTLADNVGAVPEAVKVEGIANPANTRVNEFINVLISGNAVGIQSDGEGVASLQKVLIADDVTNKAQGFAADRLTGTPLNGVAGFIGGGNYHLVPGAPAVDNGDNVPGITHDLDGVTRPIGPAADIGAYETTLQKQNQTITFGELPNRALADSPFTIQATASSGLPVTLISLTPATCTLSGNSVTLVAVGTCSLEASQPGDALYNPAQSITHSFDIGIEKPQRTLALPVLIKQ